jgi:AraC-like DNA-binding protein
MEGLTISISFVQALLAPARQSGHDIEALLNEATIPVAALNSDRARITATQFSRLSQIVSNALNDESFGYHKRPQKPGTFNAMARYLIHAETLGQAIARSVEFHNLFDTGFTTQFVEQNDSAVYRLVPDADWNPSAWVCEQTLMINHRVLCWMCGTRFPLSQVNFNYSAPTYRAEYHNMFYCPIQFEQPYSEMLFDRNLLALPIVKSRTDLENYLTRASYDVVKRPVNEKSYAEQIRRYLRKALPRLPDYEQIAEEMNINPQTLRRRLRDEGCDYRQIRNELIRDMAIGYLTREDLDIKEIAYLLGFSEPSAFIRSFRKWTDTTPGCYREEFAGKKAATV